MTPWPSRVIRRASPPPAGEAATKVVPRSVSELADVLATVTKRGQGLFVAGRGHALAARAALGHPEPEGLVISTHGLQRLIDFDREAETVTVEAGIPLRILNDRLGGRGLALDNPGDVNRHSLGGALARGMYGAGGRFGSLASQVVALELMCADGTRLHCSAGEEPEAFAAARVSLGALGIVTRVTLRTVTGFNVSARHSVEPLGTVLDSLGDEIADSDYFEARWLPHTDQVAIRRANRVSAPPGGRGNLAWWSGRALGQAVTSAEATGLARRRPGLILPALRLAAVGGRRSYVERSYRALAEWQMAAAVTVEWALPLDVVPRALGVLVAWHRSAVSHSRWALAGPVRLHGGLSDDAWLSTAYGRPTGFVAVGLAPGEGCQPAADAIAGLMSPLGGRPCWGSVHPLDAGQLAPRYPRWADWQAQRRRLDPQGRFVNPTSVQVLGPVG